MTPQLMLTLFAIYCDLYRLKVPLQLIGEETTWPGEKTLRLFQFQAEQVSVMCFLTEETDDMITVYF